MAKRDPCSFVMTTSGLKISFLTSQQRPGRLGVRRSRYLHGKLTSYFQNLKIHNLATPFKVVTREEAIVFCQYE
jgi:hypothetical protein